MTNLNIQDNSIIICPNNLKKELIKLNSINNYHKRIKYLTKEEVISGLNFSYDEVKCLVYLHQNYHYNLSEAKNYIDNLTTKNDTTLLNDINNKYQELVNNGYIKKDPLFKYLFPNKHVYIINYSTKDYELTKILEDNNINYEYLKLDDSSNKDLNIKIYTNEEDEIRDFINDLYELINKGISLNHIFIYNLPSSYQDLLLKYFKYLDLPVEFDHHILLFDSPIYKKYIIKLNLIKDVDIAYYELEKEIIIDQYDAVNKLLNLINKYQDYKADLSLFKDLLNYSAKKTKLNNIKYQESIKFIDDNYLLTDEDYCFMLGFNLGNYLIPVKDNDFLTDKEKEIAHFLTSNVKNDINQELLTIFIKRTPNLFIYRPKEFKNEETYPLSFIKLNEHYISSHNIINRYNDKLYDIEMAILYDYKIKYNIDNPYLKNIPNNYNQYNHSFKPFNIKLNHIELSATTIDSYNKCPFSYYLEKVLKINTYQDNLNAKYGTFAHEILQQSLQNGSFNLDDYYQDVTLSNFNITNNKEKFLVKGLRNQIEKVVFINNDFFNYSTFKDFETEKTLHHQINKGEILKGTIDKILIDEVNKEIIVIDYKTGNTLFNDKKIEYGLGLQLPIYLLLLKKDRPDYKIVGMYIQKIDYTKKDFNKNVDLYLLQGKTIDDKYIVLRMDNSINQYDKSLFIKSLLLNKDGSFNKRSKQFVKEDKFDEYIKIAENKVLDTFDNIKKGDFSIRPIKYGSEEAKCKYCNYKDICYHDHNDYNIIK